MKQGKSGHSVKSATALGFPTSRSKGKGEDTEGKLVPLLAQPQTAVDPVTLSTVSLSTRVLLPIRATAGRTGRRAQRGKAEQDKTRCSTFQFCPRSFT